MGVEEYAEEYLGVHATHASALDSLGELDGALNERNIRAAEVRRLHDAIEDEEAHLMARIAADHSDVTATERERIFRERRRLDDAIMKMRDDLLVEQSALDIAEADLERVKYRLRVHVARMNELGGLLSLYAATKSADSTGK